MILISNDDGIHSEGIIKLYKVISRRYDAVVVAPDRERSAISRALTLHRPLRAEKIKKDFYAVDGTPTDCVNLAVNGLFKRKIRMVISGINKGGNLGEDVTYSGTVSAAMEGTLLGIPSIAVSVVARKGFKFDTPARVALNIIDRVLDTGLPSDTLLNVNVPNVWYDALKGIRITRMGKKKYSDNIIEKEDPRGRKYYWLAGEEIGYDRIAGSDLEAVSCGFVSVTPLHMDLTNHAVINILKKKLRF